MRLIGLLSLGILLLADPTEKNKEVKGETAWKIIALHGRMAEAQRQYAVASQALENVRASACKEQGAPADCRVSIGPDSITLIWQEKPEAK